MTNPAKSRLLLLGTIVAYCLIGVEIIIMISPFALYFYSVYGPVLEFFFSSPLLSWTTEFFLPHMVFPDDPLIIGMSYLQAFLVIGLVLFFTAAIPLYYGRFTHKGVVQLSFYSKIRHPQYLFLAISGFGLLLYWPRFIILIMYVTMLFVYYLLARNEEWRMKQEASPGSYEAYMKNTPMFLPGEPGGKIYSVLFGWIQPKWLGIAATYCLALCLAVFLAFGLRSYTINNLQTVSEQSILFLPVFPRPDSEVLDLHRALVASDAFQQAIKDEKPNLAYIFPADFFLTALVTDKDRRFSDDIIERFPEVLEWHEHKFSGGLGKFFRIFKNFVTTIGTVETDYDVERFVFVRVEDSQGRALARQRLFDLGVQRKPVLVVDVDAANHKILSVVKTSDRHKWGTMPMPSF